MSDSKQKNLNGTNMEGKTKELPAKDFPMLIDDMENNLLPALMKIIAPRGFHLQNGVGLIATRSYFPKSDIQAVANACHSFCHNERVRILKEVDNLFKHFQQDLDIAQKTVAEQKAKSFLERNTSLIKLYEDNETRLVCKLQMLEFIFNIVNR